MYIVVLVSEVRVFDPASTNLMADRIKLWPNIPSPSSALTIERKHFAYIMIILSILANYDHDDAVNCK